jgi:hypothetical protein
LHWQLVHGHRRACPGDPDNKARPCHFDRGGRDKPGHDGLFCGVVSGPIEFEII